MTDEQLPPLESDDPEWVAARRREEALGDRPALADKTGLTSKGLGAIDSHRAVLDIVCRRRLVARAIAPVPDQKWLPGVIMQVICEARSTPGGGLAYWPLDCVVGGAIVVKTCRCGRPHTLLVNRLITESRDVTPGAPKRVDMRSVAEARLA